MNSDLHYCINKVYEPGSSFYYSLMKIPVAQKHALIALFALCQEIQQIPHRIQEESVARAKLQWWSEELVRYASGKPQHPTTKTLYHYWQPQTLPMPLLEELIASTELKLTVDHCCTQQDFLLYCYREAGIRTLLAAYITGYQQNTTLKACHDLGVAIGVIQSLLNLRTAIQQQRVYFPLDDFAKFELEPHSLTELKETPALQNFLHHQANRAKHYHQQALDKFPVTDRPQQRHNLVYAQLMMHLLQTIEKDGYHLLKYQLTLTPLRKFWIAWRYKV